MFLHTHVHVPCTAAATIKYQSNQKARKELRTRKLQSKNYLLLMMIGIVMPRRSRRTAPENLHSNKYFCNVAQHIVHMIVSYLQLWWGYQNQISNVFHSVLFNSDIRWITWHEGTSLELDARLEWRRLSSIYNHKRWRLLNPSKPTQA